MLTPKSTTDTNTTNFVAPVTPTTEEDDNSAIMFDDITVKLFYSTSSVEQPHLCKISWALGAPQEIRGRRYFDVSLKACLLEIWKKSPNIYDPNSTKDFTVSVVDAVESTAFNDHHIYTECGLFSWLLDENGQDITYVKARYKDSSTEADTGIGEAYAELFIKLKESKRVEQLRHNSMITDMLDSTLRHSSAKGKLYNKRSVSVEASPMSITDRANSVDSSRSIMQMTEDTSNIRAEYKEISAVHPNLLKRSRSPPNSISEVGTSEQRLSKRKKLEVIAEGTLKDEQTLPLLEISTSPTTISSPPLPTSHSLESSNSTPVPNSSEPLLQQRSVSPTERSIIANTLDHTTVPISSVTATNESTVTEDVRNISSSNSNQTRQSTTQEKPLPSRLSHKDISSSRRGSSERHTCVKCGLIGERGQDVNYFRHSWYCLDRSKCSNRARNNGFDSRLGNTDSNYRRDSRGRYRG